MPNLRGTGAWEVAATNVTSGTISTGSAAEFLVQATAPAASDVGTRIKYHASGSPTAFTGNGTDTLYYRALPDALVSVAVDGGATPSAVATLLAWPVDFGIFVKPTVTHWFDGEGFTVNAKQNGLLSEDPVFACSDDGGAVAKTFTEVTPGNWTATFSDTELSGNLNVQATLTDAFGNVKVDTKTIRYAAVQLNASQFTTDPGVEAIIADGWTIDFDVATIPAEFDAVASPQIISVQRAGFSSGGTTAFTEEVVTMTKRVRQPYPNEGVLTTDTVALSDFIYAGDIVTGVAQNSARVAPKPICKWLTPDLRIADGTTFDVQLAVAHAHGKNGKPVAAVKFIVSDGSNPAVEVLVTSQTFQQYSASGLYAPCYEASIDVSSLDDGLLEIDAVVYPHVGAAYQISVDGETYPSADCTILKMWKNSDDTYGRSKVQIGPGGNDLTGTATGLSGTPSPFLTYTAALLAAEARNLTQYGREDIGGTLIEFLPGASSLEAVSPFVVNYGAMPIVHVGMDPDPSETTLNNPNASMRNGLHTFSVFKNLTLNKAFDNFCIDNQANGLDDLDHHVEFDGVNITSSAGSATYSAFFYEAGRIHMVNSTVDAGYTDALGADNVLKMWTLVGCHVPFIDGSTRHCIATRATNCEYVMEDGGAGLGNRPAPVGILFLNSYLTRTNDNDSVFRAEDPIGDKGVAVVGCIIEKQAATETGPSLRIGGDSDTSAMQNFVLQHTTVVGARTNFMYNDTGNAVKSAYVAGCVFEEFNTKSDVFGTDGTYIGNWPVIFRTGFGYNSYLTGSQAVDVPGPGEWIGEVEEIGGVYGSNGSPINADFVNDQSGPGTGDSDLTPGASNALATVEASKVALFVDMKGRVLPMDGSAVSGALQRA